MAGHRASAAALVAGGLPDPAARPRGWLGPGLLPVGLRLARMGARAGSRGCRRSIIDRRPGRTGLAGGTAPRSATRGIAAPGAQPADQLQDSTTAVVPPSPIEERIRVFIHHTAGDAVSAIQLAAFLETHGFDVANIRSVRFDIDRPSVRTSSTATSPGAGVWSRPSTRSSPRRAIERQPGLRTSPPSRPSLAAATSRSGCPGVAAAAASRRRGPPRQRHRGIQLLADQRALGERSC